jgi:hypothetical protein
MIGYIAGAGIIVRNSIILVDFIELRGRQGAPLAEAVINAGAIRFRPMLLTAAAVVVGARHKSRPMMIHGALPAYEAAITRFTSASNPKILPAPMQDRAL